MGVISELYGDIRFILKYHGKVDEKAVGAEQSCAQGW